MPLVGYHLIGFDKGPLSFCERDLRLLASDRHRERMQAFFDCSPWKFNIFVHNRNWGEKTFADDAAVRKEADEHAHDYLLKGLFAPPLEDDRAGFGETVFNARMSDYQFKEKYFLDHQPKDPEAINFVFTSNAGAAAFWVPMTPWTIAHRMGHIQMLAKHRIGGVFMQQTLEHAASTLELHYGYKLSCSNKDLRHEWNVTLRPYVENPHCDARVFHALFLNMLTTRSGREHKVAPWFEYYPEWMAQFINKGYLDLPEQMHDLDLSILHEEDRHKKVPYPGTRVLRCRARWSTLEFQQMLEAGYRSVLDSWVGELVIT